MRCLNGSKRTEQCAGLEFRLITHSLNSECTLIMSVCTQAILIISYRLDLSSVELLEVRVACCLSRACTSIGAGTECTITSNKSGWSEDGRAFDMLIVRFVHCPAKEMRFRALSVAFPWRTTTERMLGVAAQHETRKHAKTLPIIVVTKLILLSGLH